MAVDLKLKQLGAVLCLLTWTGLASAAESSLNLALPSSKYMGSATGAFLLAENDAPAASSSKSVVVLSKEERQEPVKPAAEFEPKWITGNKIHEYLGLGAVALAGVAMLTVPGEGCEHNCNAATQPPRDVNGTHAQAAKAAVALAEGAILTGLITHWDDFSLKDGWSDPDNLHILAGVAGAALMAYAVNKSANSSVPVSHGGLAEIGAIGMLVAIKLTW